MNFDVLRGMVFGGMTIGVIWLFVATWKPRPKPSIPCYAKQQLREWEDELAKAECDLAMTRYEMIANNDDIDEEVRDSLFLVEAKIFPIWEKHL